MVDETESGACGTVGYLRDGRRSVEEQCPVEDTYQLQYDVETQTEDSVQQADGTYVVFDSEIIPLIDVVLQTRLVDADGHVVGEAGVGSSADACRSGRNGAGNRIEES